MPNTVTAIIQARMGSTRLPGKVLMPLVGKPALWHLLARLDTCKHIDKCIVATTDLSIDDPIAAFCEENNVACYRGSEADVLDRYYQTAKHYNVQNLARITADCPVIDPDIVDQVVNGFFKKDYDLYALGRPYPTGLDVAVLKFNTLETAWKKATLLSEREHVCPYIELNHPEDFHLGYLNCFTEEQSYRLTLDEHGDYELLTAIFDELYKPGEMFNIQQIFELLHKKPELLKLNEHVVGGGWLKQVIEERERAVNRND